MTVSTLTNKVTYLGNGSATSFAVPFKVLDEDHLLVRRRVVSTNEIDKTYIGTEYSYSGIGADAGTLTLDGAALSSSYQLEIERVVPYTQPLDIVNSGGFYPETLEEQLDLTTMQIQQIDAQTDDIAVRALMVPVGEEAPAYEDFAAAFQGDPGGNTMAIGLFTAASGMTIPVGTNAVYTAGCRQLGIGAARYINDDVTVDAAFVAAHPFLAFISANARGFILDKNQVINDGMIGCLPDCDQDAFTGTDIEPLLVAFWNAFRYSVDFDTITTTPPLYFGDGDYLLGSELEPRTIVRIIGTCSGHNNFIGGTRWHTPVDTRAITINVNLSGGGGKLGVNSGTAEGSLLKGIQFIPQGGTDPDACAIWLRGRATIDSCVIGELRNADLTKGKWPGHGIQIIANVAGAGALFGNANNWRIRDTYVERTDRCGLFVWGSDVNAGDCQGFETKLCGECGILDISGLGNTYAGFHLAGHANSSPLKGMVLHGGRAYQLIDPTADIGGATTPGTNNLIWYDVASSATHPTWPAWVALDDYAPSVPILVRGDSNRTVIAGGYTEGGTSHVSAPAVVIGGQMGMTHFSSILHQNMIGSINALMAPTGAGGGTVYVSGQPGHSLMGTLTWTIVGAADPTEPTARAVLAHLRSAASASPFIWGWSGEDMIARFQTQKNYFRLTGPLTTTTFGRASAVPYVFGAAQLAIIDPASLANSRIMNICATLPVAGEIAKGERYWMNNAAAGGFAENYCTTGGTIGSTAVLKTANPISA